jgi:DNA-binding LacI/PurR family transcriptional regulator
MGLSVDEGLCLQLHEATQTPEGGYELMRDLLRTRRDFTAVFCFNDISAIGAVRAITDAGLRVPRDISVVGFDDIITAAFSQPSLTTVRQPLRQMGTRAAQVLLERIADSEKEWPAEIVMEPELIVRESTGPAPGAAGRTFRVAGAVSGMEQRAG